MTHAAVVSGLRTGNYLDIEKRIKAVMRSHLQQQSLEEQLSAVNDFIHYLHLKVQIPGGRLAIVSLINLGKFKNVPKFLLDCATAVWGGFLKGEPDPVQLKNLFLN